MPTLGSHIASTSDPITMANTTPSHGEVSTGNHGAIGNCGKSRAPSQSGADLRQIVGVEHGAPPPRVRLVQPTRLVQSEQRLHRARVVAGPQQAQRVGDLHLDDRDSTGGGRIQHGQWVLLELDGRMAQVEA